MFIGREKELSELEEQFSSERKTSILIYGKRGIGKSTLISQAVRSYPGIVINFECIKSTYLGNVTLLSKNVCEALNLPEMKFSSLADIFQFLEKQNKQILVILDEYQYLKETGKKEEIDSYMQYIIDHLENQVKIILCGSYITVMRELLEEENPLFGRFTSVIHLQEMDYLTASCFYPDLSSEQKIRIYSVFGGSPYVLSLIQPEKGIAYNIIKYLLPSTGILRIYIENVMLKEIKKAYDVRILEVIGNGKKRYSDINVSLGGDGNGLLDKQLKNLLDMETIHKEFPVNKPDDKKKQFYTISDNLLRFYFAYVFGCSSSLSFLGPEVFYKEKIEPSVSEFISRRFEEIARQYFMIQVRTGKRRGIQNVGTFWYDDPKGKKSNEFDCVLKRREGYDFYECRFMKNPLTRGICDEEKEQIQSVSDILHPVTIGFISASGFSFQSDQYDLISGDDLFDE